MTKEAFEVHENIMKILAEQDIAVYFAVQDGIHMCCLESGDNSVLFHADDYEELHWAFAKWCHRLGYDKFGKWIIPF